MSNPRRYQLKCWPDYFASIRRQDKTFEVRKKDRVFAVGDILELREFDPVTYSYTDEVELRVVTYVTGAEMEGMGVAPGYVVVGVAPLAQTVPVVSAPRAADLVIRDIAGLADLIAWHASQAEHAAARAENWRRMADGVGTPQPALTRYLPCAEAADREVAMHEAAVELLGSARHA